MKTSFGRNLLHAILQLRKKIPRNNTLRTNPHSGDNKLRKTFVAGQVTQYRTKFHEKNRGCKCLRYKSAFLLPTLVDRK